MVLDAPFLESRGCMSRGGSKTRHWHHPMPTHWEGRRAGLGGTHTSPGGRELLLPVLLLLDELVVTELRVLCHVDADGVRALQKTPHILHPQVLAPYEWHDLLVHVIHAVVLLLSLCSWRNIWWEHLSNRLDCGDSSQSRCRAPTEREAVMTRHAYRPRLPPPQRLAWAAKLQLSCQVQLDYLLGKPLTEPREKFKFRTIVRRLIPLTETVWTNCKNLTIC